MNEQEKQATPATETTTEAAATAPETKPEPAEDPREAKIKDMAEKLAKFEAEQERAEKSKQTEAQRVEAERQKLNRERFAFGLERAGIPEVLRSHFAAPDKDHDAAAESIGKAWTKAVAAAVKIEMEKSKTTTASVGRPAGPGATDQGRTPGKPAPGQMLSLTARPSALKRAK
jgi:hypothetical protein